jgi:hypothetical protein
MNEMLLWPFSAFSSFAADFYILSLRLSSQSIEWSKEHKESAENWMLMQCVEHTLYLAVLANS